jgi:hypothetical protein
LLVRDGDDDAKQLRRAISKVARHMALCVLRQVPYLAAVQCVHAQVSIADVHTRDTNWDEHVPLFLVEFQQCRININIEIPHALLAGVDEHVSDTADARNAAVA